MAQEPTMHTLHLNQCVVGEASLKDHANSFVFVTSCSEATLTSAPQPSPLSPHFDPEPTTTTTTTTSAKTTTYPSSILFFDPNNSTYFVPLTPNPQDKNFSSFHELILTYVSHLSAHYDYAATLTPPTSHLSPATLELQLPRKFPSRSANKKKSKDNPPPLPPTFINDCCHVLSFFSKYDPSPLPLPLPKTPFNLNDVYALIRPIHPPEPITTLTTSPLVTLHATIPLPLRSHLYPFLSSHR